MVFKDIKSDPVTADGGVDVFLICFLKPVCGFCGRRGVKKRGLVFLSPLPPTARCHRP